MDIVERYNSGESCQSIANDVGCGKETIRKRLIKLGVQIRPRGFIQGCPSWNAGQSNEDEQLHYTINLIESGEYLNRSEGNIRKQVKLYLIHKNGHQCEICKLKEWLGNPIPLVSDHIDGDHTHNELENFRLICANCDTFTETYKSKNRGRGREYHKNYRRAINSSGLGTRLESDGNQ